MKIEPNCFGKLSCSTPFILIKYEETLKIADELAIYAYDAYLLRAAVKYNLPILTLDEGLKKQAQHIGVKVIEVKE